MIDKKILSSFVILAVFLAGCTSQEAPVKETVDTTQQSISQASDTASDLSGQETESISSDMDKVTDTLG